MLVGEGWWLWVSDEYCLVVNLYWFVVEVEDDGDCECFDVYV